MARECECCSCNFVSLIGSSNLILFPFIHSSLRLLWLTMTQFYNRCEIEYLPVYNPSPAEVADANLYANNVREVMAK